MTTSELGSFAICGSSVPGLAVMSYLKIYPLPSSLRQPVRDIIAAAITAARIFLMGFILIAPLCALILGLLNYYSTKQENCLYKKRLDRDSNNDFFVIFYGQHCKDSQFGKRGAQYLLR